MSPVKLMSRGWGPQADWINLAVVMTSLGQENIYWFLGLAGVLAWLESDDQESITQPCC